MPWWSGNEGDDALWWRLIHAQDALLSHANAAAEIMSAILGLPEDYLCC